MGFDISLSPSKLGVYRECHRCFYDANVLKIERPRGIFPSLPGGVDRVMKDYGDQYRGRMMPHLATKLTGTLWGTVEQMNKLRNWRSGLKATLTVHGKSVSVIGALDDLVFERDGTYSPFDTKTKGDVPKDDGSQYYQGQMDIYALFLRQANMIPSGKAYLDYWYPVVTGGNGSITFKDQLYTLTADPDRAVKLIEDAVAVLQGGQPDENPDCEYCTFAQKRVDAALRTVVGPHNPTLSA